MGKPPKIPSSPETLDRQAVWEKAVDVQMHFNSMMAQTRRITAVVTLALYAAATSSSFDDSVQIGPSGCIQFSLLALAGTLFAAFALAADRAYYHRLLMGAVRFAERIEPSEEQGFGLSRALSAEVTHFRSHFLAYTFYGGLIAIGIGLLVL